MLPLLFLPQAVSFLTARSGDMPTLASVLALTAIARAYGKAAVPYLVPALSFSFSGCGSKNKAVAEATTECASA